MQIIDERTIITANKNQYIKIWKKENGQMPKLTKFTSLNKIIFTLEPDNIVINPKLELNKKGKKYNNDEDEEAEEELETKIIKLKEKEKELKKKELELKEIGIKLQKKFDEQEGKTKQKNDKDLMKKNNISIKIVDCEQKINFSIICNKNDKFIKIENLFYERYPEYKKSINLFTCKDKDIDRNKSLEENYILNNDTIVLLSSDF